MTVEKQPTTTLTESAALNRERSFFRDYVKTLTHVRYMRQGLDLSKNLKETLPIGMGGWVCALLRNQWSTKLQLNFNFSSTKVSLVQFPISFPTGFLKETRFSLYGLGGLVSLLPINSPDIIAHIKGLSNLSDYLVIRATLGGAF